MRELVNVVERAVSFCDGDTINPGDLPDYVREARARAGRAPPAAAAGVDRGGDGAGRLEAPRPPEDLLDGVTFKDAKEKWVSSFEKDYIVSLLRRNGGNISHAARDADIDRKYFRKLMKKYEIAASDLDDED